MLSQPHSRFRMTAKLSQDLYQMDPQCGIQIESSAVLKYCLKYVHQVCSVFLLECKDTCHGKHALLMNSSFSLGFCMNCETGNATKIPLFHLFSFKLNILLYFLFYILVTFTSFLPISKVIALLVDLRELCNESKNSQIVSLQRRRSTAYLPHLQPRLLPVRTS